MARFTATVVLPTPPFPLPTAIRFLTPAMGSFGCACCPGLMYSHVNGTVWIRWRLMSKHEYKTTLRWTGNQGTGTSNYRACARDHEITGPLKATTLQGS